MEEPIRTPIREIDTRPVLAETLVRVAAAWRVLHPSARPETREYLAALIAVELGAAECIE